MQAKNTKTVILVAGLPYSGKTAIIQEMIKKLPGYAIFIDSIFKEIVSESEVCLTRWLKECPHLIDRIKNMIENSPATHIYVEIGILPRKYRKALSDWISKMGYKCVRILLECNSRNAIAERQAERERLLTGRHDHLKIAIDLDELYGPISAAFEPPRHDEGYKKINTALSIEESMVEICAMFEKQKIKIINK